MLIQITRFMNHTSLNISAHYYYSHLLANLFSPKIIFFFDSLRFKHASSLNVREIQFIIYSFQQLMNKQIIILFKPLMSKTMTDYYKGEFLTHKSQVVFSSAEPFGYICAENFLKRSLVYKNNFYGDSSNSAVFKLENALNADLNSTVNFHDWFHLKHCKSNKYVGLSTFPNQMSNDTYFQLELQESQNNKCIFKIEPCFVYQQKISSIVKYEDQLYIKVKLQNNEQLYLTTQNLKEKCKVVVGYNSQTKIRIINYFQNYFQVDDHFCFKDHIYISHTQLEGYLNFIVTEENLKKYPQQIEDQKFFLEFDQSLVNGDPSSIKGIWIIQSQNGFKGGQIVNQQRIRLKNLFYGSYLAFSNTTKRMGNTKINPMILQNEPEQNTLFRIINLNEKNGILQYSFYLILQNLANSNYLCSASYTHKFPHEQDETKFYFPSPEPYHNPTDVFKFQKIDPKKIWSLNLIITLKRHLTQFSTKIRSKKSGEKFFIQMNETNLMLESTLNHFQNLKSRNTIETSQLLNYAQNLFHTLIKQFSQFLKILRKQLDQSIHDNQQIGFKVAKKCFLILFEISAKNIHNKLQLYRYLNVYIHFLSFDVEVQSLISQIFLNNKNLIMDIDKPVNEKNQSILEVYFNSLQAYPNKNNGKYNNYLIMFIRLCITFIECEGHVISYNQTVITNLLFTDSKYKKIMMYVKPFNDRIKISLYSKWKDIEEIRPSDNQFNIIVEQLNLFSYICKGRNYIAKAQLTQLFECNTLISYIELPIAQQIKRIFFKMITYIYVDSNPRSIRIIPYKILNLVVEQQQEKQQQMQDPVIILTKEKEYLSTQVRQYMTNYIQGELSQSRNIKTKLSSQKSQRSQKLNLSNKLLDDTSDVHIQAQSLELYRLILLDRIQQQIFDSEMLQSIQKLIQLECYSYDEIGQLFLKLSYKLQNYKHQTDINSIKIYRLINLLNNLIIQLELARFLVAARLLFQKNKNNLQEQEKFNQSILKDIEYVLMSTQNMQTSLKVLLKKNKNIKKSTIENIQKEYNKHLEFIRIQKNYKSYVLNEFINYHNKNLSQDHYTHYQAMKLLYQLVKSFYLHKKSLVSTLYSSLIINSAEEIELVNYLYNQFKKLMKLSECSEVWLMLQTQKDKHKLKSFCVILRDVTSFFYDDQHFTNSRIVRQQTSINEFDENSRGLIFRTIKNSDINQKRQIILRNVGFHKIIFKFLEECLFIMDKVKENDFLLKPFFYCFEYLHGLILEGNQQNKLLIQEIIDLLFIYIKKIDIGQCILLAELYKNNPQLCKRLSNHILQIVMNKLINNRQNSEQYGLICFLENVSILNNKIQINNLEKMIKYFSNKSYMIKLLFVRQSENQENQQKSQEKDFQLDLDLKNIAVNKLPYIHHYKILKILNLILANFKSKNENLIKNILSIFNFNYLLTILQKSDHFTKFGIKPKLNFLLKLQISKLILQLYVYNQKIMNNLRTNEVLKNFYATLEKRIKIRRSNQRTTSKNPPNSLFTHYNDYLINYQQQLDMSYEQYLRVSILPLIKHFKGHLEKYKQSQAFLKNQHIQKMIIQEIQGKDMALFKMKKYQKKIKKMEENIEYIHQILDYFPLKSIFMNEDETSLDQLKKFSNRLYIMLNLHPSIKKLIQTQQIDFIKSLINSNKIKQYINSLINLIELIIINLESLDINTMNTKQDISIINQICIFFLTVLEHSDEEIVKQYLSKHIIIKLLNFILSNHFQIDYPTQNSLFYTVMQLINKIITFDKFKFDLIGQLLKVFNSNSNAYRIFAEFKNIIWDISNNQLELIEDKINSIFIDISYTFQNKKKNRFQKFEIALKLIGNLCTNSDYYNFPTFFRKQKNFKKTFDFLLITINAAFYIALGYKGDKFRLNLTNTHILQLLIKTIHDLLYGPSIQNQNFILQTKFRIIVFEVMKLSEPPKIQIPLQIKQQENKFISPISNLLVRQSLQLKQNLLLQLKKYQFTHLILLNRIKYKLLVCVNNLLLGNEYTLNRLNIILPQQYLKVNLIWIYNTFKEQKLIFQRQMLECTQLDEKELMRQPNMHTSTVLLNGFKLFELIRLYEANQNQNYYENDQEQVSGKRGSKQYIVKKFFKIIKKQYLSKKIQVDFQQTKYARQIALYKQNYKEAIQFFDSNTIMIEVIFQSRVYKAYFPRLPFCKYFNDQLYDKFKLNANRVSQSTKQSSIVQTAFELINYVQSQEIFEKKITKIHPFLLNLTNFNHIMIISLSISILMSILILFIVNLPVLEFSQRDSVFSSNPLYQFEEIISYILVGIGAILMIILTIKEIPLSMNLAELEISKQKNKQETSNFNIYLKNLFSFKNIYLVYLIVFHLMVVFNPIFSAFILLEILRKIETAQTIIKALMNTSKQIVVGVGMFLAFNYMYAFIFYIVFSDSKPYSYFCNSLHTCFYFLNDTYFMGGFFTIVETNYSGDFTIGLKEVLDLVYVIFAAKVIKDIFVGTIIDKFGELRTQRQSIEKDEEEKCFVCGMSHYQIDFELEGFEKHLDETHNIISYIFFVFHLIKKNKEDYNRLEKHVWLCIKNGKQEQWFPSGISSYKEKKDGLNKKLNADEEITNQALKKIQESKKHLKKIKKSAEAIILDLKNSGGLEDKKTNESLNRKNSR